MSHYIIPGVVAVVVIVLLVLIIRTRNNFVTLRNRVRNQFSQVDVQLKRRYDLIPNLLETAKGYAMFEKAALEAVVKARAAAMAASGFRETITTNEALTRSLRQLLAVGENYPELKANNNFMQVQEELSETENKISVARQFYNDTAYKYNNAIELFPANLVAGLCGFKPSPFWETAEAERQNVTISAGDIGKIG